MTRITAFADGGSFVEWRVSHLHTSVSYNLSIWVSKARQKETPHISYTLNHAKVTPKNAAGSLIMAM